MECKYDRGNRSWRRYCELIETLWNVNRYIPAKDVIFYYELIETLWNVNELTAEEDEPSQ